MKILKSQLKQLVEEVIKEDHNITTLDQLISDVFNIIKKHGYDIYANKTSHPDQLIFGNDFTEAVATFKENK